MKRKPFKSPMERLDEMLRKSSFQSLVDSGHILDVPAMAEKLGYSEWHVCLLRSDHKLEYFVRGGQTYFFPEAAKALFKFVPAK